MKETPKSLAFLFTRGRKTRLAAGETDPTEFFYGLFDARRRGHSTEVFEQGPSTKSAHFGLRLLFWLQNRLFSRLLGIGYSTPFFYDSIPALNRFDTCIAVADSVALALAYYKKRGWLKSRVLFVGMGLANRLWIKRRSPLYPLFFAASLDVLRACERVIVLGEGERLFFEREMPEIRDRLVMVPFGIDTEFWRSVPGVARRASDQPLLLFVGNDLNRDFGLVLDIARAMPEVEFEFVTSQIRPEQTPANVRLLQGSLHTKAVTDEGLRELYGKCSMVLLPLQPSIQPSGQSVCLQAMACGAPVVLTRTEGFWEPSVAVSGTHLEFVECWDVATWVATLRRLIGDDAARRRLSEQGQALVRDRYTATAFAARILALANESIP